LILDAIEYSRGGIFRKIPKTASVSNGEDGGNPATRSRISRPQSQFLIRSLSSDSIKAFKEILLAKRIAIVEDEAAIRENYAAAFRREGYAVDMYAARQPALDAFASRLPDLVIIDVNLQDDVEGGFELCRDLRSRASDLPIIFLTARDSEFDAVSGLRLGADDYLTKDISLPHLMARIAALFRRMDAMQRPQADESRITRGDLEIDVDRMTVRWKEQSVGLTLTEFWMVHALARYPGHVKNRQQLMDAAQAVLDDNTITSHIKRIRRKFIALDASFDAVETVYGMGYRWLSN
jgi:two-component system OmpR family response regulator